MADFVTEAELAKILGVTRQAIHRARKAGRLTQFADGYHVELAKLEWSQNRKRAPSMARTALASEPTIASGLPPWEESKRKMAYHESRLAEMREQQRAGELVLLSEVTMAYTTLAADFRAALERIPGKIATRLAAESDPHAVHDLLMDELDQALFDMASTADQLPARLENGSKNQA